MTQTEGSVAKLIATEYYSEEELKTLKGTFLGDEYIHHIINEDTDIFDENGKFILSFRKNILTKNKIGFHNYKKFIGLSRGRGLAAGPINKDSPYFKKRKLVDTKGIRTRYLTPSGNVSKMKVNNPVSSVPLGYYDKLKGPLNKNLPCRLTSYTNNHFDNFKEGLPFIEEISYNYRDIRPEEYTNQFNRGYLKPDYMIDNTVFSTITLNRNFRTALHKDAGDYGGIACLSVLEQGRWRGGLFMIPMYGLGINLREGDLLIADVHNWHCNSEIWTTKEDDIYNNNMASDFSHLNPELYGNEKYSRISFVCYLREKLIECDQETLPVT
jgi:hypothetical protein